MMIKHKSIPPTKPALPMANGTAITAEGAAKVKTVIPACLHPMLASCGKVGRKEISFTKLCQYFIEYSTRVARDWISKVLDLYNII